MSIKTKIRPFSCRLTVSVMSGCYRPDDDVKETKKKLEKLKVLILLHPELSHVSGEVCKILEEMLDHNSVICCLIVTCNRNILVVSQKYLQADRRLQNNSNKQPSAAYDADASVNGRD